MIPQNALMAGQPPATGPADMQAYESQTPLETLITWFEDAEEATEAARKKSERDRDYYDGNQLTPAELKTLTDRGQPDVIINRIQSKVNYLVGFEATNRTDPKGFPRTPQDEGAAEACTDALRYVEDSAELKPKFSNVWENMLVEGYGGLELLVEEKTDTATGAPRREITGVEWDWDRLFYDPHSRKHDFSDARYLGGVVWMDAEDAKRMWPGEEQAEAIEKTVLDGQNSTTYDDRPEWQKWTSGKGRKRVRIVQMYHREGREWWLCKFTKGGKLESMPVPFKDQDGESWCPLLLQSAFVDRKKPINMSELTNRIIEISKESETLFRHQAAFILGTLSTPEAIDRLTAMLEDGDQMARVNAAVGLARQNSTAGIPTLEKLFGEAASWKLDPSAVKNDEQATQHFERVMLVTNGMLAVQNLSPQLDAETKKRLLDLISQCADQAVDIAVQKQWVATKAALSQ